MTTALVIFAVLALASAFFSGYETSFVSANPIRMRYLAEEEGNARAAKVLKHLQSPDRMLATILLGNNLANLGATMAVALAATRTFYPGGHAVGAVNWADVFTFALVTPLVLIFCEIVPKSVFRAHPSKLVLVFYPVIETFHILLAPLAAPISAVTRALMRGDNAAASLSPLMSSMEDVRVLVDESAAHGTIELEEQRMIHSVINLQEKQAKEVMIPRIDIQALPNTAGKAELMDLFESTGRSRIPIYEDTVDNIIGVINVHDILANGANGGEESSGTEGNGILHYIREVQHVPDTAKVDDLLANFKATKSHMAIVTDEYGGTYGLITLEDILEEIFGEIQDEHDQEEKSIQRVAANAYVMDARLSLVEAADAMQLELQDDEVDSVGGWVMHLAGRIPAQGEIIEHKGFRLTVLEGGVNNVSKVRIDVLPDARPKDTH